MLRTYGTLLLLRILFLQTFCSYGASSKAIEFPVNVPLAQPLCSKHPSEIFCAAGTILFQKEGTYGTHLFINDVVYKGVVPTEQYLILLSQY
ncbi:hypothetical protein [Sphingobacterium hungaricum]